MLSAWVVREGDRFGSRHPICNPDFWECNERSTSWRYCVGRLSPGALNLCFRALWVDMRRLYVYLVGCRQAASGLLLLRQCAAIRLTHSLPRLLSHDRTSDGDSITLSHLPTQSANLPDTGVKKCPLTHALTHFITHYLRLAARSAPLHGVRFWIHSDCNRGIT